MIKINLKELAIERENTDWDYKIDKILSEILSMILENDKSFTDFIDYMKTDVTGDEYGTLSEISDEIAASKPSYDFIEAYKSLSIKYPVETEKWYITSFISDVEEIVKYSLEKSDNK